MLEKEVFEWAAITLTGFVRLPCVDLRYLFFVHDGSLLMGSQRFGRAARRRPASGGATVASTPETQDTHTKRHPSTR